MDTALFPKNTLAEFYRFALLLTGNAKAAEKVMAETLADVEQHLEQVRNEKSRQAWLATRIRERCLKNHSRDSTPAQRLDRSGEDAGAKPEILQIEGFLLAQHFHALPEPERSALALFYLEFFTVPEIAELLKLDADRLSDTLGHARELLHASLHPMRASIP